MDGAQLASCAQEASQSRSDSGVAQFSLPHMLTPSDVHVLLVDDERLSRMVVGNVLRKCSYKGMLFFPQSQ